MTDQPASSSSSAPLGETLHEKHTRLERLRDEERAVRAKVGQDMVGYILTAFGLVIGLAWNNAITAAITEYFPADGSGLIAKFLYALILTVVVGLVGYYIAKFFKKEDAKGDEKK